MVTFGQVPVFSYYKIQRKCSNGKDRRGGGMGKEGQEQKKMGKERQNGKKAFVNKKGNKD